jgi:hypothetical protein
MNQILPFEQKVVLPGPLPVEETLRWQGRPGWWGAATRIWHVRAAGFYFALLLADGLRESLAPTPAGTLARQGETALALIGLGTVGVILLLAWLTSRTTTYVITETHLMLRYGIALRATLVIPFGAIEAVAVRVHSDHTGDLALRLRPGQKMMFLKLWPHVRPWTLLKAEPMLRGVHQAGAVGALLTRGVAAQVEIRARLERELALRPSQALIEEVARAAVA